MTVILGEGLVVPGGIDSKNLKTAIRTFLEETPNPPDGAITYKDKVSGSKYKVTVSVNVDRATITNIKTA